MIAHRRHLKLRDPYLAGAFVFLAGPLGFLYFSWRAVIIGFALIFVATALFRYSAGLQWMDVWATLDVAFARDRMWSAWTYIVCAIFAYTEVRHRNSRAKQINDLMNKGMSFEESALQVRSTYQRPDRREQIHTSFAAGLGAAGGLMAYFAIFGLYGEGGIVKGASELFEFLAVTGVVLWLTMKYIDPFREYFVKKGAVGQHDHGSPLRFLSTKERWVIAGVTASLAIFVELYRHGLATTGPTGFTLWTMSVLVASATTYYWIEGVATYPPRAHTKGAAAGAAVAGGIVVLVLLSLIYFAHLRHLPINERIYSTQSTVFWGMAAALSMAVSGFVGGLALNHSTRLHPGLMVGIGLAVAGIAVYLLTLPLGPFHSVFSPHGDYPFVLAGWVVGLLIYHPSAALLSVRLRDPNAINLNKGLQDTMEGRHVLLRSHLWPLLRSAVALVLAFVLINGLLLVGQRIWHRQNIEAFEQFNRTLTERHHDLDKLKADLDGNEAEGEKKLHALEALNNEIKSLEVEFAGASSWPLTATRRYRSLLVQRNGLSSEIAVLANQYRAMADRYNAQVDAYNKDVLRAQDLAWRAFSRWFFLPLPGLGPPGWRSAPPAIR